MTIEELSKDKKLHLVHSSDREKRLEGPFCCDLLSLVISRGFKNCVWITVMANINTIAVASLIEVGALVFAEGMTLEERVLEKAIEENISIFYTEESIFETGLRIHEMNQRKEDSK